MNPAPLSGCVLRLIGWKDFESSVIAVQLRTLGARLVRRTSRKITHIVTEHLPPSTLQYRAWMGPADFDAYVSAYRAAESDGRQPKRLCFDQLQELMSQSRTQVEAESTQRRAALLDGIDTSPPGFVGI